MLVLNPFVQCQKLTVSVSTENRRFNHFDDFQAESFCG